MITVSIINQGFSRNHVIVDGITVRGGVGAIVHWVRAPKTPQNVSYLCISGNEEEETFFLLHENLMFLSNCIFKTR